MVEDLWPCHSWNLQSSQHIPYRQWCNSGQFSKVVETVTTVGDIGHVVWVTMLQSTCVSHKSVDYVSPTKVNLRLPQLAQLAQLRSQLCHTLGDLQKQICMYCKSTVSHWIFLGDIEVWASFTEQAISRSTYTMHSHLYCSSLFLAHYCCLWYSKSEIFNQTDKRTSFQYLVWNSPCRIIPLWYLLHPSPANMQIC